MWIDLDADSFTTGHTGRDAIVKGPDLLDVARFPFVRFESRAVEPTGRGRWRVTGDVYIRDQVGEVVLDTRLLPAPDGRIAVVADASLRRSAFGLRWAERFERLGLFVADSVRIRLGVEFAT